MAIYVAGAVTSGNGTQNLGRQGLITTTTGEKVLNRIVPVTGSNNGEWYYYEWLGAPDGAIGGWAGYGAADRAEFEAECDVCSVGGVCGV